MVLLDLGKKISNAVNGALNNSNDDFVASVDNMLKAISTALLQNDVNIKLVSSLRSSIRNKLINGSSDNASLPQQQRKNLIQKTVFDELCNLIDCKSSTVQEFKPRKRTSNVIMFVGLQGAGKTTTCTKLAVYYASKGFKVGLVCADTFRAGAFDQLKQNAIKANIPFYGSYSEPSPVKVAMEGVAKFKKEKFEIIIVDTSGRHQQEESLFEEMIEISNAVKPNQTLMVLDASIGQVAEQQAKAFKESSDFGSIILTKMDGHAKGGGAISAVAASQTPISFIGTGEHIHDFEKFSPQSFIKKMLGLGDIDSLKDMMESVKHDKVAQEVQENMRQGKLTLLDFRKQMEMVSRMGSMAKMTQAIPGLSDMMGGNSEQLMQSTNQMFKTLFYIMDSMTKKELNSDGSIFFKEPSRMARVARGSGTSVGEVEGLIQQFHQMGSMMNSNAQRKLHQEDLMAANGLGRNMSPQMMQQKMQMLKQQNPKMYQDMMQQVGGPNGMQGFPNMPNMPAFPGMGGAGGMNPFGAGGMPFGGMNGMNPFGGM
ncbi:hypothetical protein ACO0RG_003647 [Hanseniaspora osmophila]|uniref:signal-recognition-particle GTPase n=1 Tax=Hanseniaspora osmophila TaxID=56408 RepID=A0A1E5RF78_9ASCO|nr:Signal recognition particle subunit SRP54 [Hanseniaspora osmophila]